MCVRMKRMCSKGTIIEIEVQLDSKASTAAISGIHLVAHQSLHIASLSLDIYITGKEIIKVVCMVNYNTVSLSICLDVVESQALGALSHAMVH